MKITLFALALFALSLSPLAAGESLAEKEARMFAPDVEERLDQIFAISLFSEYDDQDLGFGLRGSVEGENLGLFVSGTGYDDDIRFSGGLTCGVRLGVFQPYLLAGATYGDRDNRWTADTGLGVRADLTERLTAYSEWVYGWADEDSDLARIGIAISF